MNMISKIITGAMLTLMFSAVSCSQLDVVGNDSVRAFEQMLEKLPPAKDGGAPGLNWSLRAPDKEAALVITRDKTSALALALELDARPFLRAGLHPEQLNGWVYQDDKITFSLNLANSALNENASLLSVYQEIVKQHRSIIGYHSALDHYGLNLGDGNMFEWAKDMSTNDKDIVFVLNPEPFIKAGLDPKAVAGWVFAKVETDVDGRPQEVDKLLKPFDLR